MPRLVRSAGSATAWIIEPNMSGLISAQSSSPDDNKICRDFLVNFGQTIRWSNNPPLTYGKSAKSPGKSPSPGGVLSLSKNSVRNSCTFDPSLDVLLAKVSVNILLSGNIPVSSAKKQNNKRERNILSCWLPWVTQSGLSTTSIS